MTELDSRYSSTSTMSHRELLAYYGYLRPTWLSGELAHAINAGLRIVGSGYPLAADDLTVLLGRGDRISLHHPELEEAVRVLVAELSHESSQPDAKAPDARLTSRSENAPGPPILRPLHDLHPIHDCPFDPWTRPVMGNVSARLTSSPQGQPMTRISDSQPDVGTDLRNALSAAIDALGKVMLEMQRRRLLADSKTTRRTRKILVNDPKKLTDEQVGALAADAFEAGTLMLASIGHPGTGVFSCNSIDGDAP